DDLLLHLPVGQLLLFDDLHHLAAQLLQQPPPLLRIPRIRQQRRDQRRPARRQRSPRRPDVQRRDVPVPYVLLVHGIERRLLQRKGDFYEARGVSHGRDTFVLSAILCLGGKVHQSSEEVAVTEELYHAH